MPVRCICVADFVGVLLAVVHCLIVVVRLLVVASNPRPPIATPQSSLPKLPPFPHDEGFPQPHFSPPELVEPQDEGAQATYNPEDAIVFEDAFETGLGEVKGEDEMKSTEFVPDPTQLTQPTQVPTLRNYHQHRNQISWMSHLLPSHSHVQCDGPNGRIRTPQLSMYHMARISRFSLSTNDVI